MLVPLGEEAFWGAAELRGGAPRLHQLSDVLYLPKGSGPRWGLYGPDGAVLQDALDRWGPEGRLIHQSDEPAGAVEAAADYDAECLYIGRAQLHYGHFLVETLARCWPLAAGLRPAKLLVHGADFDRAWGGWTGHAFASAIFELLGYAREDLVHFDRPTRLRRVIVAEPALQQQAHAYPVYLALCRELGRRASPRPALGFLLRRGVRNASGRRVWLSRRHIYSGTMRVRNEDELEARLVELGFAIAHPDQLPFAEQVALFDRHPVVCGLAGSAFHTDAFSAGRSRRVIVSPDSRINSQFRLLDRLTGRPAEYFGVGGIRLEEDLGPGHAGTDAQRFARTYAFSDPRKLAESLADLTA